MVLAEEHGFFEELIERFYLNVFPIEDGSALSEFLTHFTYDLIRTFLVFFIVFFIVSYLKTYISMDRVKRSLLNLNRWVALFVAAICGLFASTCVCTNVPLFLGFISLGVPLSLATTYLISSSLINIASLISMLAIDGFKFTLVYFIASMVVILAAGFILSLFKNDKYLVKQSLDLKEDQNFSTQNQRIKSSICELKHNTKEQSIWILLGVFLAAIINSFVSVEFVQNMSSLGALGVFITTLIGVVFHTDIIAITPVLSTFLKFHMNYGILFSLTASLSFFSIPVIVMLKKTVKFKYVLISWAIMFILIFISGVLLIPISE